jgi:single-stranded-DNA-specific exonuclease
VSTKSDHTACRAGWTVPPGDPDLEDRLVAELRCSRVLARLLCNRGVREAAEASAFLAMRLVDLLPPEAFDGMPRAVARIREALRRREPIAVFGDYDVDGVAGTAILYLFLHRLGTRVRTFLPHRMEEGYGLSRRAVDRMHDWGARLVITVDNGVGAAEEIAYGRSRGLDFVVTDHHEVTAPLPDDVPVLNPKCPGESYPFRELAGAGVAFKLAWALARELSGRTKVTEEFRQYLLEALALASLGTVADVVPITGENRILTYHGLRLLREVDRPGLQELAETAVKNGAPLKTRDVAFRLGPVLNAAGRLGDPERAFELLTTGDRARARELVAELSRENDRRRRLEQLVVAQAREAAARGVARGDACLVLAHEDWHVGVVGIAAARLAEETERPVVLIAREGEEGRGSGRSAGGVLLHEAVERCRHLLEACGGHAEACGIRIRADRIAPFAAALNEAVRAFTPAATPPFLADMVLPPHEVTGQVLDEIERLAPFGQGNERPRFIAEEAELLDEPRLLGRAGNHLTFMCRSGPATFRSVYFGGAADRERITSPLTFAYEPAVNSYRGYHEIELMVKRVF